MQPLQISNSTRTHPRFTGLSNETLTCISAPSWSFPRSSRPLNNCTSMPPKTPAACKRSRQALVLRLPACHPLSASLRLSDWSLLGCSIVAMAYEKNIIMKVWQSCKEKKIYNSETSHSTKNKNLQKYVCDHS